MRCVRRAWLCGLDPLTGLNYEHRKGWIEARLAELARIFAIDACVFAVLSNHYHLLLRNRPDLARQWSDEEVARRWWQLCPQRFNQDGSPAEPSPFELGCLTSDAEQIAEWRRRLSSISWLMKFLNQSVAKRHTSIGCRILARVAREGRALEQGFPLPDSGLDCEREPGEIYEADVWLCPINEQDCAPLLGPAQVESVTVRGSFSLPARAMVLVGAYAHGAGPSDAAPPDSVQRSCRGQS